MEFLNIGRCFSARLCGSRTVRRRIRRIPGPCNLMFFVMTLCTLVDCGTAVNVSALPSYVGLGLGAVINLTDSAAATQIQVLKQGDFILSLEGGPGRITLRQQPLKQQLLWVANYYNKSLMATINNANSTYTLKLSDSGDLQLLVWSTQQDPTLIWNTNTGGMGVQSMNLSTSGNLMLLDAQNTTLWQSFDHPNLALLPTQHFRPGMEITAPDSTGSFAGNIYSMVLENGDLRLYFNFGDGSDSLCYWSISQGDLSKVAYAGLNMGGIALFASDGSIIYQTPVPSAMSATAIMLSSDSNLRTSYLYQGMEWRTNFVALSTDCMYPSFCGPYGICSTDNNCRCPPSFQPVNSSDLTQGCLPPAPPVTCKSNYVKVTQGFLNMGSSGYDYVSNQYSIPLNMSLEDCKQVCLDNCSCVATFYYIDKAFCFHIQGEVRSIQKTSDSNQLIFLKVTDSAGGFPGTGAPLPIPTNDKRNSSGKIAAGVSIGAAAIVLVGIFAVFRYRSSKRNFHGWEEEKFLETLPGLPRRYHYKDLQVATKNFSQKLGAGGFGSVFHGTLPDKSWVAVKVKEQGQGQGKKQFQAEVATIGSIDHVNLVKLRGFCMEGQHRILVYEYMARSSLDRSLFGAGHDPESASFVLLDWKTRYSIALATARGIAYLHEGSNRRIIHCDIKPENILLDEHLTAKLSDFGLSKVVQRDRSCVMSDMRGTRGYVAPEWLLNAPITEKSDVYSYGMVLLELCSGRKNTDLSLSPAKCYLPAWAASLAQKANLVELVDEQLGGKFDNQQAQKLIKISLSCIQEDATSRPTMGTVVKMLEADILVDHFSVGGLPEN